MSSTDTRWQELLSAALLGTQRRPFQPVLPAGAPEQSQQPPNPIPVRETQVEDSEVLLLREIAATALFQQAGRLPPTGEPANLPPCPPDDLPRCSRLSGICLERILSSSQIVLLREWAQLAAARRVRVREEQLPALLQQQKAIQPYRSELLPVLGERGRWLAALNSDWQTFRWYLDEGIWHEGSRKERLAYFMDERARDPNHARALLESTWEQETPLDRAVFLQALSNGLSMADEPFLEKVLDDHRAEVCLSASGLLARLPQSRLVDRMTRRAQRLLLWKSGLLRSTLEVILPETCPEDLLRDGVTASPPPEKAMSEREWWLAQILAAVPPRTWTNAWNRRPNTLLELSSKQPWHAAILFGWSEAAVRHADDEWIEALLQYETRQANPQRIFDLFNRLPERQRDIVMTNMLQDLPSLSYDQPASLWLSTCRFPWSKPLTLSVTRSICISLQKGDLQPWRWEILLREIGAYFHPQLLEQTITQVSAAQKRREKPDPYARDLLSVLQFRLDMHRSFA